VKLAAFETSKDIQTVVAGLAKNPANRADEWLAEAARLLVKTHKTEAYKEGPNLLPNPGFEAVGTDGLPEGWKRRDYGGREANRNAEWTLVSGAGDSHSGKAAMRCITRGEGDTSFFADVTLKPNTQYRLSGWIKTHALNGKASLNDHINRHETDLVRARESDWVEVEVVFNSKNATRSSINILHVARGDSYFDDVKLCELLPAEDATKLLAADPKRGEGVFYKHAAACILCHSLKGEGSTVGPPLDGIAVRKDPAYILESLRNPSAKLAEGFEQLGVSPMPPMNDVLGEQEMVDVIAFLATLKTPLPPGTVIKPPALPSFE
jgi:mono/diheme cytochrome c family protein